MKKLLMISLLNVCLLLNVSYADAALPPDYDSYGNAEGYFIGALVLALVITGIILLINKKKK